jgi:oxygen-independent coproporphyrinogen-3 oxidase
LAAKHYDRYEVSAYARPGFQARHNLNYWQFGDYLGIGAGAHGKVTQPAGIRRTRKRRSPQSYLQSAASGRFLVESAVVQGPQAVSEFMLNGLRLRHGFDRRLLHTRAGGPPDTIDAPLAEAIDRGWLRVNGNEVIPTRRGYDFLNDLQLLFF